MAPQKSPRSTSATLRPRCAASSAAAAPKIPPPMTARSNGPRVERVEVAMHGGHGGLRPQAGALAVAASFLVRTFTSLP